MKLAEITKKVQILTNLCQSLYTAAERISVTAASAAGSGMNDGGEGSIESKEVESGGDRDGDGTVVDARVRLAEGLRAVYDRTCLTALSRLVQAVHLRPAAREYLLGIPRVPPQCLAALRLLMHSGTKGVTAGSSSSSGGMSAAGDEFSSDAVGRNRGTRVEALRLLGHVVFSLDEAAGIAALQHLLWCCVSEDFEVRSRVVNLVVK